MAPPEGAPAGAAVGGDEGSWNALLSPVYNVNNKAWMCGTLLVRRRHAGSNIDIPHVPWERHEAARAEAPHRREPHRTRAERAPQPRGLSGDLPDLVR